MTTITRPLCAQTGSTRGTGACLAATSGSCGYCGLPAEVDQTDQRIRVAMAALADEQARVWAEAYR